MGTLITWVVVGSAIVVLTVALVLLFRSCYRKVEQGHALIVNKMKKLPEVSFTGALVLPVIHKIEVMDISAKTIIVDRRGDDGLICKDNIRADIKVAFFVRVNQDAEDVLKVASMIGVERASDQETLENLFQAKFSEALKTVGKRMDFVELYNERHKFKQEIIDIIGEDLYGYCLEDAAIDYLEQTPLNKLDEHNILDAQGRRKIIDLTSEQTVQANEIQRDAEKTIKKQDVEAREVILALERQQADAEITQKREIMNLRAREEAEMAKVNAEEELRAGQARIQTDQELGIARENSQRELEIAAKNRERVVAVEAERVEKDRQLEAVSREKSVSLSVIEKEKVLEVERKNIAEVTREKVAVEKGVAQEEERIKDLRATMEADRSKQVAVTQASQAAEERKIKEVAAAEASHQAADFKAREHLVMAEAQQEAAEKQARAQIRLADGIQAQTAAHGLANARVLEAEAAALEKQGLAKARVKEADAEVLKKTGEAEGVAIREKMSAEAAGIAEKAESMKLLNDSTKDHEEFRLRLDKELEIAMRELDTNIEIATKNAEILAEAFKSAKIDIVGGDGQFIDRFVRAVSFGKSVDGAVGSSDIVKRLGKDYLNGDRSLPDDVKEVLASGKIGAEDFKHLTATAVLGKLLSDKDPDKTEALLEKAKQLGFGDSLAGWLTND